MSVLTDLEHELEGLLSDLGGKKEAELRALYAEALAFEVKVKKEIVLLRERAANLASDSEVEAELMVISGKELLAKAITWLKDIEQHLSGTNSVKDFNTGERFE